MRRIRLLALVVAVAAAVIPATPARAADSFTFYGSGWGHGLGLSQWGAYGLAKKGWSHKHILTHFYTGTEVVARPMPDQISVGLATGLRHVHLTALDGPLQLSTANSGDATDVATIPAGQTWTVEPASGAYQIRDSTGHVVGGHGWGGSQQGLHAGLGEGAKVTIPEGGATYNRGDIEFNLTCSQNGCRIRLVLTIPFEQYLLGIGEVPSNWPMQALEAQAVAARSYALYKLQNEGPQPSCNCDVLDGVNDQVYIGWNKEGGLDGARWVAAVQATAGQIVTYRGKVALTLFSASDGGHTEDIDVQWGTPLSSFPYLAGVCDPGEYTAANPWTDWRRSFTASQITKKLRSVTGDIGSITGFAHIVRGVSGRIGSVEVQGAAGTATITGWDLRSALELPDDRVWLGSDHNVLGAIRTKYDELMCKPGLPTSPVKSLPGGERQAFATGAIYANTGAGVTVWLRGPIYDEYLQVGGATGTLGLPVSGVIAISKVRSGCGATCARADFAGGRVYWKSTVGAHAIWGPVLAAYLAADGAGGRLGFPTSRIQRKPNGSVFATFERGTLTCHPGGTCATSG